MTRAGGGEKEGVERGGGVEMVDGTPYKRAGEGRRKKEDSTEDWTEDSRWEGRECGRRRLRWTAALGSCAGQLCWAAALDDACRVSLSVAEIALFPTNEDDH